METMEKVFDGKTFVFHKIPAVPAREILLCYGSSVSTDNYAKNEDMMYKILSYVSIKLEGKADELFLKNEDIINNHILSAKTLIEIEKEEFDYNFDFLSDGEN